MGRSGSGPVQFDPALVQRIRDLNGLDLQLLEHGAELFERQWVALDGARLEPVHASDKEGEEEEEGEAEETRAKELRERREETQDRLAIMRSISPR